MACDGDVLRGLAESIRSAEAVYASNKSARDVFFMSDDAARGIAIVEKMIVHLSRWEAQLRKLRDASRSCGKNLS
jgi:hypothetical protein